jgi:hypothetical protein
MRHESWVDEADLAAKLAELGGLTAGRSIDANLARAAISHASSRGWLRKDRIYGFRPERGGGAKWMIAVRADRLGVSRAFELAYSESNSTAVHRMPLANITRPAASESATLTDPTGGRGQFEEDGGTDDAATTPALSNRAQFALEALLAGNAFDSDHRMTTAEVAAGAGGTQTDANQYKEVVSELKRLKYVQTKEGRGGGCWLTAAGRKRAENCRKL